jgi:predicted Zn-dependent peptidase
VNSITASGLMKYYREFIAKSRVQIFYCGSAQPDKVEIAVKSALADLPRRDVDRFVATDVRTQPVKDKMRRHTQRMNVNQGKLCIGFRLGSAMLMPNYAVLTVMNGLFGGAINSKLFQNVREKLSLCYYCASRVIAGKNTLIVDSGVELANAEKAHEAILEQLEAMKRGEFPDELLENTKYSMVNALKGIGDTPMSCILEQYERFYTGDPGTVEERVQRYLSLTKEQIVEVANSLTLDTVYLMQQGGAAE